MSGTPRNRRNARRRPWPSRLHRVVGMDTTAPMSQSDFDLKMQDFAMRNAARFGTVATEDQVMGSRFGRAAVEHDPGAMAARADLEATAHELEAYRLAGGLPGGLDPTQPAHQFMTSLPAGATAQQIQAHMMAPVQPGFTPMHAAPTKDDVRLREQQLRAAGLDRLVAGRHEVVGREQDVYGAGMEYLEHGLARGVNRMAPGAPGSVVGGGVGPQGMPNVDLGAFQHTMEGSGGPNAARSLGLLEKLVDIGQRTFDVESLTNQMFRGWATGSGPHGGGGGGGGGAGGGFLAGAAGDAIKAVLPEVVEAVGAAAPEALLVIAAGVVAQLGAMTRAHEYEPIRQLELGPGQSQTGDINQVARGEAQPFTHTIGGRTAEELRYRIQRESILAAGGFEMGQQIAQRLELRGVGFGETRRGQAADDLYQTTRVALGPGRAAGYTAEESADVVGFMRAQGGLNFKDITHQFEDLIDVSQRLGVGTKNLSESYKTMLEAGLGPHISATSLAVSQAFLGAGTNVGGFMSGVAQMAPNQQLAMAEALGIGPRSSSFADQKAFMDRVQDPKTVLAAMSGFTHRTGGAGGFEQWRTMMQSVTGGEDLLGMSGMNLDNQRKLWEKMTTGQANLEIDQIAAKIPKEGTGKQDRKLEDPEKYVGDAIKQLGQNMTPLEKSIQNLISTINHWMASGLDTGAAIKGHFDLLGKIWSGLDGFFSTGHQHTTGYGSGGPHGSPKGGAVFPPHGGAAGLTSDMVGGLHAAGMGDLSHLFERLGDLHGISGPVGGRHAAGPGVPAPVMAYMTLSAPLVNVTTGHVRLESAHVDFSVPPGAVPVGTERPHPGGHAIYSPVSAYQERAALASFTHRTGGAGGFQEWRELSRDIAGHDMFPGMNPQQQEKLWEKMAAGRYEATQPTGVGSLHAMVQGSGPFGLAKGGELPGTPRHAHEQQGTGGVPIMEPAPWLMSMHRFGLSGATPMGRALTPPMDFESWRSGQVNYGGAQGREAMAGLSMPQQYEVFRLTLDQQRERRALESSWTQHQPPGAGGVIGLPQRHTPEEIALNEIVQLLDAILKTVEGRRAGQGEHRAHADWGAISPAGPHGHSITQLIGQAFGLHAGALSGPAGLAGMPGESTLTPNAGAGLTSALAQAFSAPAVSGSLMRAVQGVGLPSHGGGVGGGAGGAEGARQGQQEAEAFTMALMRTLLPALADDMGQAFDSPAVRTAMAQALIAAINAVTSQLAQGVTGVAAQTGATGTGTGTGAGTGTHPGTGAHPGSTAGILEGVGGHFRAFSGAGPTSGMSVFSGKASQGSATLHPDVLKVYEKAAAATGVPLALLLTQGAHESMLDPTKVGTGDHPGYGLAQFTDTLGQAGLDKYLHVKKGETWQKAAMDPARAAEGQAEYMRDLYKQAGGNWQSALDMYNAGPNAKPAAGDYGSQILSAAGSLDLQLGGTLTVIDQSGQKVGTAQINRQHQKVHSKDLKGHRTSGQDAGGQRGPKPS